ncbi:MAG TPA: hypothetical protein VG733_08145 [Chthoniobacteraceae bacterium]|nr:hypothetical protein [Chthoniobacteraceae bacterium]
MKTLRLLAATILLLPGFTGVTGARAVATWSYQELFEKSDVVVIAYPTATNDTKEQIGIIGQQAMGVETRFAVSVVLKGDKTLKDFILHHYRTPDDVMHVPNGPTFVSFAPVKDPTIPPHTFILFLVKEADGRYAPVAGQTDSGLSVRELTGVGYAVDPAAAK